MPPLTASPPTPRPLGRSEFARWGKLWIIVILACSVGGLAFGLPKALASIAILGFVGALVGLRLRALGLLSIGVLCSLDPAVRLLLFTGGFLRFNTLNYLLLLVTVLNLRQLLHWKNAQLRILFVLIAVLSVGLLMSPGRADGVQHILNLVSVLGILVYMLRAGFSAQSWLWLGGVCGLATCAIGTLFSLQHSEMDYLNSNAWVYVPLTGLIVISLAAAAGKPGRLAAATLVLLGVSNAMWVLLSGSRGGLIVALVCLGFLFVSLKDAQVRSAMVLAGGIAVIAMGAWFAQDERAMLEKIDTLLDSSRTASKRTDGHVDLAIGGWNVFVKHPLGVGTGGFAPTWSELGSRENVLAFRSGHQMQAHSAWVKTLAENGVLGFLCLVAYVTSFLWIGWRSGRSISFRLGAFVTAAFATAFLSTEFGAKGLWFLAAGAMVLLAPRVRSPKRRIRIGSAPMPRRPAPVAVDDGRLAVTRFELPEAWR